MATRKIKVDGWNHDAATTAIVTWDGVVVFNGALTAAVVPTFNGSNDPGDRAYIFSWEYNNADDTLETDHTVSIEITAGSANIGNFFVSCDDTRVATYPTDSDGNFVAGFNGVPDMETIDGSYYYTPGNNTGNYGTGEVTDHGERTNVTINGEAPTLLSGEGLMEPVNGTADPRWNSWGFHVESGDTWAATVRVPKIVATYVPN
jgi:hypothetical protein